RATPSLDLPKKHINDLATATLYKKVEENEALTPMVVGTEAAVAARWVREWGGRGVKEKNMNQALNSDTVKDGVVPSATATYEINNGTQDENLGHVSSTAPTASEAHPASMSFATLLKRDSTSKSSNFHSLITSASNKADVVVPLESIRVISEWFVNTTYGFFLGKRVVYPVVANYVRNTWGKYELVKLGKSSYARALIEVRADVELKDNIVVAMPKLVGEGFYTCTVVLSMSENLPEHEKPSQTTRGVPVGPKVGFKPVKQVYRQVSKRNNVNTSGNKKKDGEPTIENMKSSSTSPIPIVEEIDKIERLIIDGKVTLVDDEGKPLTKVDSLGDHDSEDEVESVDNEMANFLASKKVGYGTNSLLEQWKKTYENDDYDFNPYDDNMYEGQDIPDKIQAICDNLNMKV
ncbi:hypothetical protein Tco_1057571, partial [Tanacetum coccineum]